MWIDLFAVLIQNNGKLHNTIPFKSREIIFVFLNLKSNYKCLKGINNKDQKYHCNYGMMRIALILHLSKFLKCQTNKENIP
jgi:hypothetical protein